MKEAFRTELGLVRANVERLELVNEIVDEYAADGYKLTLRQLYYQLVSRAIIANNQKEYAKLSSLLVKGRMAGVVDWDIIEDRIRVPYIPYYVSDIKGAMDDTIDQYRLDRMKNQNVYIELWVEKDALSGVLRPITSHYHINLMVNRGYSSCSAMYDAAKRFKRAESNDKSGFILYLGDHDPSGLDMIHDIRGRLEEFEVDVEVKHVGLTTVQVRHHNPPPNPVKFTDSRAKEYVKKFGETSWEVDALNPKTLNSIITRNIEELIDHDLFDAMVAQEETDKKTLRKLITKVK